MALSTSGPSHLDADVPPDSKVVKDWENGVLLEPLRHAANARMIEGLPDHPASTPHPNGVFMMRQIWLASRASQEPSSTVIMPLDSRGSRILICFAGPPSTPYANGVFAVQLALLYDWPIEPPTAQFLTRIYHPNVAPDGKICMDVLERSDKRSWSPAYSDFNPIAMAIVSILHDPGLDDPLVPEIARTYVESRALYNENASKYTKMYATIEAAIAHIPPLGETELRE